MKSQHLVYWIALTMVAIPSATLAATTKFAPRIDVIARAAANQNVGALMAPALTRQLFRRNSPLEARWNAAGQVQVYVHFNGTAPRTEDLLALGATDITVSQELDVAQAWIPATQLEALASLPEVARISVPRYTVVKGARPPPPLPRIGSVDTEGDSILGAQQFRQMTGYTGQGTVVGVISDGDDGVSTAQGTGDLPSNIWNDPNNSVWKSAGSEGTAMMEIVYDLAPGVKQLGFCGPQTSVEFITCLDDFASDINANVIVDDLGILPESMFSDGAFATAVANFATAHPNIHLVTAAGNDALGFWSGGWNPSSVNVPVNGVTYTQAENFGAYTQGGCNPPASIGQALCIPGIAVQDTVSYTVIWDDLWDATDNVDQPPGYVSPNDYDVVLFDSGGKAIACNQGENVSTTNGTCTYSTHLPLTDPGPTPVQGNQWQNKVSTATAYLQIFAVGSPAPRNFKVLISSAKSDVLAIDPSVPGGSIYGQSAVASPLETTVGAICELAPNCFESFTPNNNIEVFSSQGPVTIEFPTAAKRTKPDFVAPDCVHTTGDGGFGSPFCGTSAAAPHIAGLMALLISAYPSGSDPYTLLQDSTPQPPNPNDIYGYGLPNMTALLSAGHYPSTSAAITSPASGASVSSGEGVNFKGSCLGYDGTGNFTYDWNFGSSGLPDSSQQSPTVTFSNSGNYTVKLTCTNKTGTGSATSSLTVTAARFGGGGGFGWLALLALLLLQLTATRRRATE